MTIIKNIYGSARFQDQGFVPADGRTQAALKRANERLLEACNKTPKGLRAEFRSSIRWVGDGYEWKWVLL